VNKDNNSNSNIRIISNSSNSSNSSNNIRCPSSSGRVSSPG